MDQDCYDELASTVLHHVIDGQGAAAMVDALLHMARVIKRGTDLFEILRYDVEEH